MEQNMFPPPETLPWIVLPTFLPNPAGNSEGIDWLQTLPVRARTWIHGPILLCQSVLPALWALHTLALDK